MRIPTLIKRNITYYWRTNLAVVLGVATAVAVLAGALVVGDSVRASLRTLFLLRLGNADYVISSPNFFREQLAEEAQSHNRFGERFAAACPLISIRGVAAHEKSGRRGSGVQVYGVDARFWQFHGVENIAAPGDRDLLISASLAEELNSAPGDTILLTFEKLSDIPTESLHGRKDDVGRTIRLAVRETLPAQAMGEFSISPRQSGVRAVFVSLQRLQKDLDRARTVNTLLVSERSKAENDLSAAPLLQEILKDACSLEDLGIKARLVEDQQSVAVESDSAMLSDALTDAARATAESLNMRTSLVLTYLANSIRVGERAVPYSVVTALDSEGYKRVAGERAQPLPGPPILLNEWAARDLGAKAGDRVTLEYYVWLKEGRLETRTAGFHLAGVVPIEGAAADRDLVPDYPGITGTESLSDWDPPFPMDLGRIRPIDEDYWDRYRATPKAFILIEDGQRLWQSRFGKVTSLRVLPAGGSQLQSSLASYGSRLRDALDPAQMGLELFSAREQGVQASRGATDFGEYFVYFSFFIVASALLLTALFFKLGIEQRLREIGLLRSMGFPASKIRTLFVSEGLMLASLGGALGILGALGYGALMMLGLRTWWVDAVGTRLLSLHASPASLMLGAAGGVVTALLCIVWTLRSLNPASPRSLLSGSVDAISGARVRWLKRAAPNNSAGLTAGVAVRRPLAFYAGALSAAAGAVLLVSASSEWIGEVAGFFGAGISLLVALICFQSVWLRRNGRHALQGSGWWPVSRLGFRNATHRPGRSVLCIALISSATFIIVAVDAFRREGPTAALDKRSGSGGFPLLAESLLPITNDPNTPGGRESLNLHTGKDSVLDTVVFTRFRVRPGDDASCLNLYQPRNPKIMAPRDDFVKSGRFAFKSSLAATGEERSNPWLLLDREEPDGAVPVIADANSLTYVLHLKVGDEFVLDHGGSAVRLRVVGALADSIFQGELLMGENNFLRLFPHQEGYRFFLLDAPAENAADAAALLEEQLSDFGFDVIPTGERLASFHRVENTYLSTFQTLGGLGLLLGTLGLATVLLRNVFERRKELALLRAVGYKPSHFALMVVAENALLLSGGLASGVISALLAIAPAFISRGGSLPTASLGSLLLLVFLTGLAASVLATIAALRSPLIPALRAE